MRRSSSLPKDLNQRAAAIVRMSTEEPTQTPSIKEYLASIGRKGGLKGGLERARRLSPSKRKSIAKKAAQARWKKKVKI